MNFILRIYKWAIFEISFMSPSQYDDLDFVYFAIGILPFYFCVEEYLNRVSLIFQICWGNDGETIFDFEKVLKEYND